jgi:hypothetical protein
MVHLYPCLLGSAFFGVMFLIMGLGFFLSLINALDIAKRSFESNLGSLFDRMENVDNISQLDGVDGPIGIGV